MARPTKLTPELQQSIVDRIIAGNFPEFAAQSLGITPRTYYGWMRRGKQAGKGMFFQFLQAVIKARATDQVENVLFVKRGMKGGQVVERRTITKRDGTQEVIEKFSKGEWQAGAWMLERKFPHLWGLRPGKELMEMGEQLDELRRRLDALSPQSAQNPKPAARLHRG
jgi:hypothetical protein